MERRFRRAAKVLLVDEQRRVLLFGGVDRSRPEDRPRWFAPGGALEPGEEAPAAAVREVFEETGLSVGDPGPAVEVRRFHFEFEGASYDQEETYFLVRTNAFEPSADRWSANELATTTGYRWWSAEELRATNETVYPEGLADFLEQLLGREGDY